MILHDPLDPEKRDAIRKILLSSIDGFDTMLKALKRELWRDEFEIIRAWTRCGFQLDREAGLGNVLTPLGLSNEEHAQSQTVFGIPRAEVGLFKKKGGLGNP